VDPDLASARTGEAGAAGDSVRKAGHVVARPIASKARTQNRRICVGLTALAGTAADRSWSALGIGCGLGDDLA
jgi:hypothetical protein